ncbi:hypothetical protein ABLN97_03995 [Mycobacterium tuberculosis]
MSLGAGGQQLSDIPTDARADKITLAVRLETPDPMLYQGLLAVAGVLTFVLMRVGHAVVCGGLGGRAFWRCAPPDRCDPGAAGAS